MRLRKISVSFGETLNLGNYESARVDVSLEADLDEDDPRTLIEAYRELRTRAMTVYTLALHDQLRASQSRQDKGVYAWLQSCLESLKARAAADPSLAASASAPASSRF